MDKEEIRKAVKERYGEIARKSSSCCTSAKSCCGSADLPQDIGRRIGYTEGELKAVPDGANLGLGCGNPIALASLKEGEIVLDLGSGAGFDCFLAATRVGDKGRVIGVDMTPEMLDKARGNAKKGNFKNVEFRLGEIENLPVADNQVDIVISNCVINLSPAKERVFEEAFRVLKPGARFMVSDIALQRDLPDEIKNSVAAYVSCLAGAVTKGKYLDAIRAAGFEEVRVLEESTFPIEVAESDPIAIAVVESLKGSVEKARELAESIVSIKVCGRKPGPDEKGRS